MAALDFLDRKQYVAPPDYDRWLALPAAIAVYLGVGIATALTTILATLADMANGVAVVGGEWPASVVRLVPLGATVCLGGAAFALAGWIDAAGPRRAIALAAALVAAGSVVTGVGVSLHRAPMMFLGAAVLVGSGMGVGYAAPITALVRWFPDRPGVACGLAVAAYSAGRMLGHEIVVRTSSWAGTADVGGPAWMVGGAAAGAVALLLLGVAWVRLPDPAWRPPTYTSAAAGRGVDSPVAPRVGTPAGRSYAERRGAPNDVPMDAALRTPQFWWTWLMVFLGASAVLMWQSHGSSMIQDTFPSAIGPSAAAGFVAVLALAELVGRIVWSTWADLIGRRRVYMMVFGVAAALCATIPSAGREGNLVQYLAAGAIIVSVGGAVFAMLPAFVYDTFGALHTGGIHARLLSALSAAAVLTPRLVSYARTRRVQGELADASAWTAPMLMLAAMLVMGVVAAWSARNVHTRYHVRPMRDGARG